MQAASYLGDRTWMKAGNSLIGSYYKVQVSVSKDENNKYNAIYEDHNIMYGYRKSICNVSAHRETKFVSTVKK